MANHLLKKIVQCKESEQVEILKILHKIGDKRLPGPLLQFMDHDVSFPEAKRLAGKVVRSICKRQKIPVPEELAQIERKIKSQKMAGVVDLGLKLVDPE